MAGNNTGVQDYWQPRLSHVLQRTTHMFNNPQMSDVSFIFKKSKTIGHKIYGHKFVLGMSSPVFFNMFYNDQFSKSNENIEIRMTEKEYPFDYIAFLNFMEFLYKDHIGWKPLSIETVIGVMHCSEFYNVPRLKIKSGKALMTRLKMDNVILLLETALLFSDKDLEEKCWAIIDSEAKAVFELETILEAKMETLFEIIRRDNLVVDESQVLDVCLKWSEKECERKGLDPSVENKRQVLDKIFFQIRFPILPSLKIAELVGSNFLTQKESLDMLLHIHCAKDIANDKNKSSLIPKSPFKTKKRVQPRKILKAVRIQPFHAQHDGLDKLIMEVLQRSLFQGPPPPGI